MLNIDEIIGEYVIRLNNAGYTGYPSYIKALNSMGKIDLGKITEDDVENIVEPYLYEWGGIGRVLGRVEFYNWKEELAKQISTDSAKLDSFKSRDLINSNLSIFQGDILSLFKSFKEAVGPIAAAKSLHMICPNFFPLWDNSIAKAAKTEGKRANIYPKKNSDELSENDYYGFMEQIRTLIMKHKKVIFDLANQYGKGYLKIADECLWWATQRPLNLLLE